MELYVISGRSGSGKSSALHVMEDLGYYCVDNLPIALLPALVEEIKQASQSYSKVAVGIDARNLSSSNLASFSSTKRQISTLGVELSIIFLDANEPTLIRRFSETKRKHPMSSKELSLSEAVELEKKLLEPILEVANLVIDTSKLTIHDLRDQIRDAVSKDNSDSATHIILQSFGFKHGIPLDSDFIYDIRCLPNPHWIPELRTLTGQDQAVIDFLGEQAMVKSMYQSLFTFLKDWIPKFEENNRSHMTISIGCTGGQHRSVYMVEKLWKTLSENHPHLKKRHRELS